MIMLFLFAPLCVVVLALCLASALRKPRPRSGSPVLVAILVGLVLSYGLALLYFALNPWFDDNGAREFIEWRYRWVWAAELAGWLAIVVVPVVLGLRALLVAAGFRAGRP